MDFSKNKTLLFSILSIFLLLAVPSTALIPGLPDGVIIGLPSQLNLSSDSTVIYMPFDNDTGTDATDVIAPHYNGTLANGAVFVAGYEGQGVQFDSVNDVITLPSTPLTTAPITNGTISFWLKRTTQDRRETIFIRQKDGVGTYVRIRFGSENNPTSQGGNYLWFNNQKIRSTTTINTSWTHIAIPWNTTHAEIYINGLLDNTSAVSGITLPVSTVTCTTIGGPCGDQTASSQYFHGFIDGFRIDNVTRTAYEIYQMSSNATTPNQLTSIILSQLTIPQFNPIHRASISKATFTISSPNSSAWVPVPINAVDISESFAYGAAGVFTIDDNKYVAASSMNASIPISFDATTSSELPDELYMDDSTKTFEYTRSIKVSNPSDIAVMLTINIPRADLGLPSAKIDGSLMSLIDSSLITPISLGAGESKTSKFSASIPLAKQDVEFRSTFDDFLEIDTYAEAATMAENVLAGKTDTMTRTVLLETTTDMSYNNRSVIIPLKVDVKDVIEAKALSGSKELLDVREGSSGAELVIPDSVWNSTSVLSIAQAKVIFNKEPSWYEGIPGLSALGSLFETLKNLFGGD